MTDEQRFAMTVYSQNGYYELDTIRRRLLALSIQCGITNAGLSVSGPMSSYPALAEVIGQFPKASLLNGQSVHQHVPVRLRGET